MDKFSVFFSVVTVFAACFESSFAEDMSFAALVTRIEALELQGKQQQVLLREQNERILKQEMTIKMLQDWKEKQPGNQPSQQETGVGEHEVKDQPQVENISYEDTVASRMDKQVARNLADTANRETRAKSDTVRHSRIVLGEGPVAFHALITLGDSTAMGVHQKIVFDSVKTNIGGGYHNLHGLFIAPIPGVYIFSTAIMSHSNDHVGAELVKNGVILARSYAHSTSGIYDQGSVTVVVQVAAGDEIWVQNRFGSSMIYGDSYTSFMGCLVTPL